ncbi:MAG TPA: DoxX family protein [Bacteroidia bacterium]
MILLDCTSGSCSPCYANIHMILQILVSTFFAILFLQSGMDKVNDRKGNLAWMTPHFEKSPMKNRVPLLLTVIAFLELSTGILSIAGIAARIFKNCDYWMFWANLGAASTLLCLFLGQRMAKDYAGAQSLVSYFIVALAGLWLCSV